MLQRTHNPFGLNYGDIYVETQRLYVRAFKNSDCANWLKLRQENYNYLQEREPIWDMDALTYQAFYRMVNDLMSSFVIGNYYSFGIFEKNTDKLVGGFEISNVMYWPKQCATIGYWINQSSAGQGYATEVLANMANWAFKTLNLVKIEAGTMVSNATSQRVLTKVGFSKEGLSHCYGEINGVFEDHILWGITSDELNKDYVRNPNNG